MSIVVLSNVVVPLGVLTSGLVGSMSRENIRGQNQAGFATVNVVRDVTMRSFQISTAPMLADDADKFIAIAETTDYGAYGMLIEDPMESVVTASNGTLQGYMLGAEFGTPGFGNGTPRYGLRKLYAPNGAGISRARALTRPVGNPVLTRGGSPVSVGGSAGFVSFTAAPVYVDFVADATRNVVGLTVGATTTVTLSTAIAGFIVGGRLWLQGFTGADAALLNNQSHQITAIASNVYTLATNTAGKTITFGSAQGHKYPQPDEALTAAFRFLVPVHFRDDRLEWELVIAGPRGIRQIAFPSTYLDEIREA
ncbi:MAG: hypothetical protein EOP24_26355 [Hyphomicrobiales bacterium]|nr:MAG: hypothetical protein EOP24_26355 [Hyphomicrobiales bacterium]